MRALLLMLVAFGCSSREERPAPKPSSLDPERIAIPTSGSGPPVAAVNGRADKSLAADEGSFEVTPPPPATVGTATTARIRVRPGESFHINTAYPFVLTLANADGLQMSKLELRGGRKGSAGDAEVLAEQELSIPIVMTPTVAGRHTLTGTIAFGLCKKDRCIEREMPVSVVVEAS